MGCNASAAPPQARQGTAAPASTPAQTPSSVTAAAPQLVKGTGPVIAAINKCFPGAVESKEVARRSKRFLVRQYGLTAGNTLYGESTCPDEINHMDNSLGSYMQQDWGECFQMGGIGGCPYVGKFGVKALFSHAPDNGNIVILFGPHVGISPDGEVGKYLRVGQSKVSTACGAAIAAFNAGISGDTSDQGDQDIQQSMLKQRLGKQAKDIASAEVPMAELAYRAYKLSEEMMMEALIPSDSIKHIILLGGIQINMPEPFNEYFLPLKFAVSVQDGAGAFKFTDMLPSFNALATDEDKVFQSLNTHFAGYQSNEDIVKYTQSLLQVKYGFTTRNTLYGQSLCVDEANHGSGELSDQMRHVWGHVFNLGGVAGIPFVGKTGFTAFSHHVPDDGNLFVVYAPHVGISPKGEVGKLLRDGQHRLTTSCGAAVAGYQQLVSGSQSDDGDPFDMMTHLLRALQKDVQDISASTDPQVMLARKMFAIADKNMRDIINFGYGKGWLALLGGIQINLSSPLASVFLPLKFTIAKDGVAEKDLMPELLGQFKLHTQDAAALPSGGLPKREGVYWARQRS